MIERLRTSPLGRALRRAARRIRDSRLANAPFVAALTGRRPAAFDGPGLTAAVKELLFQGRLDVVEPMIFKDMTAYPRGEHNRIRQLRGLFRSVRDRAVRLPAPGRERITLSRFDASPRRIDAPPDDLLTLPPGLYEHGRGHRRASSFATDFARQDAGERDRMALSRFDVALESGNVWSVCVARDAFLCGDDLMMHAYAFDGHRYINANAGRVAKSCAINTVRPPSRTIPSALLLPIPHHAGNYYHVLCEMAYGLHLAPYLGPDVPIVYQEDRFAILPTVCARLGIDPARLMPFGAIDGVTIGTAVIPGHPPYYWNDNVFSFFRVMAAAKAPGVSRVYLSRRFGTRGPANEAEIEDHMARRGFTVIHAESLTFAQQMDVFSAARVVVSTHGAGLANIAFMARGTTLIEMFPEDMLTRNYYLRSRHNAMSYGALIFSGTLEIGRLDATLAEVGVG